MSEIARDWEMLVFNYFIVVEDLVHSPFNRGNHWRLPTLILFVTLLRLCPFAHLYKCIDEQRAGRCSSVMHSSLLLARSKAATAAAGYPDTFYRSVLRKTNEILIKILHVSKLNVTQVWQEEEWEAEQSFERGWCNRQRTSPSCN